MKPTDLVTCSVRPTVVNSYLIERLEIDLRHINYGLNHDKEYSNKARSKFTIAQIILFFESLNNLQVEAEEEDGWEYFIMEKMFFENQKNHRIVFCINIKNPHTSGVVTLFQTKRKKYELS